MTIQIDQHTMDRAKERGASEMEIHEVLKTGIPIEAKKNRLAKAKVFLFEKEWNNKYYPEKKIEVYYIIKDETIITVTVYVYYGYWEDER